MTVDYPESVDLVVLGTGLVQSVIAWCGLPPGRAAVAIVKNRAKKRSLLCSAAARQGKSVLIVDANEYYGEIGATQSLSEFRAWLDNHAQSPDELDQDTQQAAPERPSDSSVPPEIPLKANVAGTVRDIHTWFRHESAQPGTKFCIDLVHQVCSLTVRPSSTVQS